MDVGKEKGYVLYDEVNELLTDDLQGGRDLDDLLTEFDSAGVEILEEPKLEKIGDAEEIGDLALAFVGRAALHLLSVSPSEKKSISRLAQNLQH